MRPDEHPPVCDYEGSDYRTRFWEGKGRDYEDQVERVALRRLLPPAGATLIDVGAGFGRLASEYHGYDRVILFDFSRTLLREAQARLGHDDRFRFVAGNWYDLPFVSGLFQAIVQVRTIHHAADVPALFSELARVAAPGGRYILEFANKQNLKAILRYGLRRQRWSPFAPQPVEFVALNYDFHPRWIQQQLRAAGFAPRHRLAVSHFRLGLLKRLAPTKLLVALDALLQPTARWLQLTPSVFVASDHPGKNVSAPQGSLFACPVCKTPLPDASVDVLTCSNCNSVWRIHDGLYDFKESAS